MSSLWLRCQRRRPNASTRLVCLPHAGGTAAFFTPWADRVPAPLEVTAVQYPGRQDRRTDPPAATVRDLATSVAGAIDLTDPRSIVLFGHSLGALVAYELARVLTAWGRAPDRLVVSGRRPPGESTGRSWHTRSDADLIAELVRLGGMADIRFFEDAETRRLFLPAIRDDFRLAETYRHRADPVLSCPVTAVIGADDPEVDAGQAARWADCTTGRFDAHVLPGDHFYLVPHRGRVLSLLSAEGARLP
ncbi:surfactin synthase thioesterase subunit [Micromonospora sp. Llam0]|uniref:thioesterase II family protein n=1 Tax=Micromonospora sp. Llam0 TaxID=2485143 RepID=UPI000F47A859|nr:alpha/beta fold hydrolase [Micromonospora sp. Llam0]ROO60460.1 surfactin synthase thioesterase subunit [Micromonospora sp. Llam0]